MGNNLSDQAGKYKYEDFNILKSLKTGAFGQIYIVELKNTKELFIMKRLPYLSDEEKKMADEEVKMLKLAQSQYTVQLITGFQHDVDICILQEFCLGGNLRNLIVKMKTWTVENRMIKSNIIFFQILMSLKHIHSLKIVHRDLKPENVFLDKDGNAKTGDFGLALNMASQTHVTAAGTQIYQPPEAQLFKEMKEASDIWALGVIVAEMITGVHPFAGRTLDETVANIINGRFKPLPDYIQGELKEMIIKMMAVDPVFRPTTDELLNSDFMQILALIDIEKQEFERFNLIQQLKWLLFPIVSMQQFGEDLKKQFEGTEQQKREIINHQEINCEIITLKIQDKKDKEIQQKIIQANIIDGFIFIFENRELKSITRTYTSAFSLIIDSASNENKLYIFYKKPYPGLIRLLEHSDWKIVSDSIMSIFLLINAGSTSTPDTDPHPHYDSIQEGDGVSKIFALFQKTENKYSKDKAALCLSFLFRQREITDSTMRMKIINHIKGPLYDADDQMKEKAKNGLKYLIQNTDEIGLLIYSKNPYPGLIRLLEHENIDIVDDTIGLILLILWDGAKQTQVIEPHPHYETIQACDGVNKIYSLFQRNVSKYSRDRSALCIGYLFKAQQITGSIMRNDIFNHLKNLLNDSNDWIKQRAKSALKYLAQNE
ncbi:MAG: putative NEK/NEK2 protein kinase, partial [Streblomastix strix]